MNTFDIVYNKNIQDKIFSQELNPGAYIVSTPIGNILDITIRALFILHMSSIILCEDTRVTSKLLSFYGIHHKKLIVLNDITENRILNKIMPLFSNDAMISIVSDCGTPLISDPGFKLVRTLIASSIPVFSIPGPSAAISALTLSGFPTDRFLFAGFLSTTPSKRIRQLQEFKLYGCSVIIYESPYKLLRTLSAIIEVFGPEVELSISKEITKQFETTFRASASELLTQFSNLNSIKGEFVLIINQQ